MTISAHIIDNQKIKQIDDFLSECCIPEERNERATKELHSGSMLMTWQTSLGCKISLVYTP